MEAEMDGDPMVERMTEQQKQLRDAARAMYDALVESGLVGEVLDRFDEFLDLVEAKAPGSDLQNLYELG